MLQKNLQILELKGIASFLLLQKSLNKPNLR